MFRAGEAIRLSVLSIALAAAAGCATASSAGNVGGRDVHATARIAGDGARVLVSGPAWLLHVDVDGRDDLALFSVARKDGSDADCAAGATAEKRRLRPGVANRVNLSVAADETICIRPAGSTRTASVMWHAKRLDTAPAAGRGPAIAFDEPGR